MVEETPINIEELKIMANSKRNWKERLEAVTLLRKYDCQQSRDIVTRLALHDPIYNVQREAFLATQALSIKKDGKPIYLGKKKRGNYVQDIMKLLTNVRDSLLTNYTLEEFKKKFSELYPEAYDIYEGNMGNKFDGWLSNVIPNLSKKK